MSDTPEQNYDHYKRDAERARKRDAERARKLAARLFADKGIAATLGQITDLVRIPGSRRVITSLEQVREKFEARYGTAQAAAPAIVPLHTRNNAIPFGIPVTAPIHVPHVVGTWDFTVPTQHMNVGVAAPAVVTPAVSSDAPIPAKAEEYLEWLADSFGHVLTAPQRKTILTGVVVDENMKSVINKTFLKLVNGDDAPKATGPDPLGDALIKSIPTELLNKTPRPHMVAEIDAQMRQVRAAITQYTTTINTHLGQLKGYGEKRDAILNNQARSIEQEIRDIVASGNWDNFEFLTGRLTMTTKKNVIVRTGDSDLDLGKFAVIILLAGNFDIKVVAIGENKFFDINPAPHPFVDHHGQLCWGQFLPTVMTMYESSRLSQMVSALYALLTTYDPRSTNVPFVRYEDLRRHGKANLPLLRQHMQNYRGFATSIDRALRSL